ncbi:hypothetical protein O7635_28235 [Asanoa sp. WMMD1127]|uniref:hypothetical protein n=1 Tax=Asanoa sp. WMMD1127 TaxID=3016107 RepID=UPI002416B181|nr:hypothetical protein [Asanoa sp. WMMD1127]MDG4825754.1 hypothetical protein [Asanoa sp. WMMD1127]
MSEPSHRAVVVRRLLRAGFIALAVVVVTVLFFAPSAEGRARPPVADPGAWPMVSLVALAVLAIVVPASLVVLVLRRRY